jgi:hypothetical protein
MLQFLEDAYGFASSFVVPKKSEDGDHEMTDSTAS